MQNYHDPRTVISEEAHSAEIAGLAARAVARQAIQARVIFVGEINDPTSAFAYEFYTRFNRLCNEYPRAIVDNVFREQFGNNLDTYLTRGELVDSYPEIFRMKQPNYGKREG